MSVGEPGRHVVPARPSAASIPSLLQLDASRGRNTATGLALFALVVRLVGSVLALRFGPLWFAALQAAGALLHGLMAWRAHRLRRTDPLFLYSKGSEWTIWGLATVLAYGTEPSFHLLALLFLASSILLFHEMPVGKRLVLVLIPFVVYFPLLLVTWKWGPSVQLAASTARGWSVANEILGTAMVVIISTLAMLEHARARREAEMQARISAELVEDLSHELRTPIATILTASQGARGAHATPESTRESVGWIEDSARSAGRLVVRMLDLAALERGETAEASTYLPLLDAVRSAVQRFGPLARERSVELAFAEPMRSGSSSRREVDAGSLDIVLHNLLSNAVEHSPVGGRIEVRILDRDRLRIEVEDEGSGIAPDDLPRVFDRLWRADRARSREHGRHGLGLAIARRHAQFLGAELEVRSRLGQGSVFSVVFDES